MFDLNYVQDRKDRNNLKLKLGIILLVYRPLTIAWVLRKKINKKRPNTNKFQAVTLQYYYIKGDKNKKATSHEMKLI